jgi:hypothetical protein
VRCGCRGRLDLLLDSRHRDDRASALVVDFKTGVPRSDHDRAEVRFYALLAALATGRMPFRWATFYVAEGRPEAEDLHGPTLEATVLRVLHAVRQAARLAAVGEGRAPRGCRAGSGAGGACGRTTATRPSGRAVSVPRCSPRLTGLRIRVTTPV